MPGASPTDEKADQKKSQNPEKSDGNSPVDTESVTFLLDSQQTILINNDDPYLPCASYIARVHTDRLHFSGLAQTVRLEMIINVFLSLPTFSSTSHKISQKMSHSFVPTFNGTYQQANCVNDGSNQRNTFGSAPDSTTQDHQPTVVAPQSIGDRIVSLLDPLRKDFNAYDAETTPALDRRITTISRKSFHTLPSPYYSFSLTWILFAHT